MPFLLLKPLRRSSEDSLSMQALCVFAACQQTFAWKQWNRLSFFHCCGERETERERETYVYVDICLRILPIISSMSNVHNASGYDHMINYVICSFSAPPDTSAPGKSDFSYLFSPNIMHGCSKCVGFCTGSVRWWCLFLFVCLFRRSFDLLVYLFSVAPGNFEYYFSWRV